MAARVASLGVARPCRCAARRAPACGRPARRASTPLELCSWPGPSGAAGRDELVAGRQRPRRAGGARSARVPRPATTAMPSSAAPMRVPAAQDGLAGADVVARPGARCGRASTSSSSGHACRRRPSTSSTCRTASAPSGTAAPVEMRTASPSPTADVGGRARARLADDAQRAPGRARAHREAVHRAVGEGGHVARRRRRPRPARGRARPRPRRPRRAAGARRRAPCARASSIGEGHGRRCDRAAVGRGWYPGWRCPRPRSAPGARIRSPTCRPQRSRTARRRPRAGCSRSWPRGRCATRRRCRCPTSRATPRRCARRSCARSAPTPSCAGWSAAATSPASRRAPASWPARAARRPRWPRSRRCAPRCGRR